MISANSAPMPPSASVADMNSDARPEPAGTTARVAAVIDAVVARHEVGVRELAAALGISRSATHRIAQALARLRVLHALPSGRYEPGARLLAWAASLGGRDPMLGVADEILGGMSATTNETAYLLGYREGETEAVVLKVWPGSRPIRYTLAVGSRLPLHAGAAGKAILAWLDPSDALAGVALTDATLTGADLAMDLATIRARGYALSVGERIAQAAGAAAPLFRSGQVAGAAGFTIPRQRLAESDMTAFAELARDAVARIGAALDAPRAGAPPAWRGPSERGGDAGGRDVARVVEIIDALVATPATGVDPRELADQLAITAATANATLGRLAEAGIARRNGDGRFKPDVALLTWPGLLPDHTLPRIARDVIVELAAEVNETVCLLRFTPATGTASFDLCEECDQPIQYVVPLGTDVPLHAGAGGKAILAHVARDAWPRAPLQAYTESTITSVDALQSEVSRIREQGFATSVGEHLPDAAGIAAPYFVDGAVAGALTITMPGYRFDPQRIDDLASRVRRCCSELTDLLSATRAP